MTLPQFAAAAWVAVLALFPGSSASHESRDAGIATNVQGGAVQKALDWLGKDCTAAHILYYVDASKHALLKVQNRSEFDALLAVHIHHIRFTEVERRDIKKGLYRIEYSSDVQEAAKQLGAELTAPLPYGAYAELPSGGAVIVSDLAVGGPPRMPNELDGISLKQALDQVAQRFRSTVTVGFCRKPRRIDMVFYEEAP